MGTEQDLEYGKRLLAAMRPFAEFLAEGGLAKKTVKRHLTNLWILGGVIIRDLSLYRENYKGDKSLPGSYTKKKHMPGNKKP